MCRPQGENLQEVEGSKCCIWPSRCHGHSLSLAPVNPEWFYLSGTGSLGLSGQNPEEP